MRRRGLPILVLAVLALNAAPAAACEEVTVPLPDGVKLHGWFKSADGGGKRPVIWTMTPYDNRGCPAEVAAVDRHLARKFNLVRLSYRGTGASEGVSDQWGPQTARDVNDVAEWITSQPWADGLLPLGASAEGAWITYALAHPAVKAALWETSCADPLRGCIRNGGTLAGGVLALTAGVAAGYVQGLPQRVQHGHVSNPTPAEQWTGQAPHLVPAYTDDTNSDFWKERLGLHHLERIHAPVMYTTDLYDFVPQGMYVAYEHTKPEYRWLNLSYGHNSPSAVHSETSGLRRTAMRTIRRFVERFGLGVDNGFEDDPRVTILNNLGTVSGYLRSEVLVRGEPSWPLRATRWTRLHLGDGTLSEDAGAAPASDVAPLASVGPTGELRTTLAVSGGMPAEQREAFVEATYDDLRQREAAGLTYTTPPLASAVELTGPVVARLFASTTAPDFDWQVRLTDVHPDGRSSWITDGQLRASLREIDPERSRFSKQGDLIRPWYTFAAHQPVPPGEVVEYHVELAPTSNIFRAGHRIRLDIQPAGDAYVDSVRTGGAGVLQLMRGSSHPSSVLLPLIPRLCRRSVAAVAGLDRPRDCASKLSFEQGSTSASSSARRRSAR